MPVFTKVFIALTGMLFIAHANAQELHTQWTVSTKKVSECEYDVIFSVKIDPKWHMYSSVPSVPKEKGGAVPYETEIKFTPTSGNFSLIGGIKESTPKKKYDDAFDTDVRYFEKSATFTQRVKATKSGKLDITGFYKYEACADVCEFSPKRKFSVSVTIPASAPCLTSTTVHFLPADATRVAPVVTSSARKFITEIPAATIRETNNSSVPVKWETALLQPVFVKELACCSPSIA